MKEKIIEEKLKFHVEMVKLGTTITVAVGGGTVGLLLNPNRFLKVLAGMLGLLVILGSISFTVSHYFQIKKLFKALEEEK